MLSGRGELQFSHGLLGTIQLWRHLGSKVQQPYNLFGNSRISNSLSKKIRIKVDNLFAAVALLKIVKSFFL